ncbi:hypothetical protein [Kribbella sp. NPDC051770]|uniref:hypothetical protein n=1 Tax=Kribbella sp. NPDC051770 TaxID=3155413 RepID=UPI00343A1B03
MSATVTPVEDPMPVLRRRRRNRRKATGLVVAMLVVIALSSGRDGLRNALLGSTEVDPVAATTPLRSDELLPARIDADELIDQQVIGPGTGRKLTFAFETRQHDVVRVVVRCASARSYAVLRLRAEGFHSQRSTIACSRAGDVLDLRPDWLWNFPWESRNDFPTTVSVELVSPDSSAASPSEAAIGLYRSGWRN